MLGLLSVVKTNNIILCAAIFFIVTCSINLLFFTPILFHQNNELIQFIPLTAILPTTTPNGGGTATSGKLFSGKKIRQFPKNALRFDAEGSIPSLRASETKLPPQWAHKRPCPKWSVTTTIFEVSEAMRIQSKLPSDWCMVIVGDRKGLQQYELNEGKTGRIVYLNVTEQEAIAAAGSKLATALPWNSFGRKNLGYFYAISSGAQLIWDFDDDNSLLFNVTPKILEPKPFIAQTVVLEAKPKNKEFCESFNPMPLMGAETSLSWPRGIPLLDIKAPACQPDAYTVHRVSVPTKQIGVYQSLANHDPDVDALYRISHTLPFNFKPVHDKLSMIVPSTAYSPFNAQATLFTYEAMFMLILPITVHGRVADIWRSYFGQRLLRDIGFHVAFTHAQVIQERNVHNYLADLDSEQDLYMKSGKLIEYLKGWSSACKTLPCRFEALIVGLYEHNYLEIGDVELIQIWISSLIDIGYKFSPMADLPESMDVSETEPSAVEEFKE